MSSIFNRRYKDAKERRSVIEKVDTVLNGDAFQYYKEKFFNANSVSSNEESVRQLFTDFKKLSQVLDNFKSFCPLLEPQNIPDSNPNREVKSDLVKLALKTLGWKKLNEDIYDLLETEGDVFFYIYFDPKDVEYRGRKYRVPKLSLLSSKDVINIVKDDANNTVAYVYEQNSKKEYIDYADGTVKTDDGGKATYIFKKGEAIRYIDSKKEDGMLSIDEDGRLIVTSRTNSKSYAEMIPIIHISGNKRQDEKFSVIPAQDYVEVCLHLMQIESDIRATNRQSGFPTVTLLDCQYVDGDGRIGGVRVAETTISERLSEEGIVNIKGQVIQHTPATNESFFKEEDRVTDSLYNLVGVTNPTLMQRVGSSDSSKVIQQVNARMERKVEKYIDNIIEAFTIYFKILFLENNLYDSEDETFSFQKPRSILKNSAYDDMLIDTMGLNSGIYTLREILQRSKTKEEIDEHMTQINKEVIGKYDVSVQDNNSENSNNDSENDNINGENVQETKGGDDIE